MNGAALGTTLRSALKNGRSGLRTALLLAFDSMLFLTRPRPTGSGNQALLVRLDYIGDFLLWLPSARAMCRELRRQGTAVALICNPSVEELARTEGIFDEVIALDRRSFAGNLLERARRLRSLSRRRWRIVLNPTFSREPLFADAIVRFASGERKIGFRGDSANTLRWARMLSERWYTELAGDAPAHELGKNERLLRAVFGDGAPAADYSPLRSPPGIAGRFTLPAEYVVLFPGVSWEGKKWPLDRFASVGRKLQESRKLSVVLLGSRSERGDADAIAKELAPALTRNLAGETSLRELIGVIAGAKLLVSNDTSAVHIAALSGVPCVAVLGGGHFGRFLPYPEGGGLTVPSVAHVSMPCYGCAWNCVFPRQAGAAVACIDKIPTSAVAELAESLLGGKRPEIRDCGPA